VIGCRGWKLVAIALIVPPLQLRINREFTVCVACC
jgi:hypothetical protein